MPIEKSKVVTFLKHGNLLLLDPTTDHIFSVAKSVLTYSERRATRGKEAAMRRKNDMSPVEITEKTFIELDTNNRVATYFGFWKRLKDALIKAGYTPRLKDMEPPNPEKFKERWSNISGYSMREGQAEFIQAILKNRCGRIDCPPGFGKSFMIGVIAALLPKARIDVITKRVSVLRERIYPELVQMVGDVGIVGGGRKIQNKRVMCYTADSAHHALATDADVLFGDEVHELAADEISEQLARWINSRNYGLSASHDRRWDNKDIRTEGIFGPLIYKVTYTQAEKGGLVVPIHVHWSAVQMTYDPSDHANETAQKRYGIWRNTTRNTVIANDARRYDKNTQTLIVVETVDHALFLKKLLPEFTLVYNPASFTADRKAKYVAAGICDKNEIIMTDERRIRLTQEFEQGKLKKAIATSVWNVGVSFNKLAVLIRADAGSSQIADIQIPGRVSRISDAKPYGIVHDYLDQFSPKYSRRANGRMKMYKESGWSQFRAEQTALEQELE